MAQGYQPSIDLDSDCIRRALAVRGLLEPVDAPLEEVESVIARLYGHRLKTFRRLLPNMTMAQLMTFLNAKDREWAVDHPRARARSPLSER